jgi:diaminopimelate decarboxylase
MIASTTTFDYRLSKLYADGVSLDDVIAQVGTPCYIYSRDQIIANWTQLRHAFSDLKDVEFHYSLKANANLALVRLLVNAGAGMDAVSGGEVFRALRAGADPAGIVFAGVGKTEQELHYALQAGVGWINAESVGELNRLNGLLTRSERGQRQRVALRVNPDVRADTHHYIATGHATAKFGIPLAEAHQLLEMYATGLMWPTLDIAGLHVHIGSQLASPEATCQAVGQVLPLYDRYPFLHTLNLGGGFPASYDNQAVTPIQDFANAIKTLLVERPLSLLFEPGRYVVANAGALVVEVQYVKHTPEGVVVVTDGGMTELIRPVLYGATHGVLPLSAPNDAERVRSHIVGPVCESADVLRTNVMLPPLKPGDKLAIMEAGAYGAVMGSTYNARPRPPEVLVEADQWRVIRRRETWHDLISLEEDARMT